MITNREIPSEELLVQALEEVVENARENGVDDEFIAAALRESAAELAGNGRD